MSDRPEITESPEDQTVAIGEVLTLHCRAAGQPRPQISWLKNDLPLPTDARITVDSSGSLTVNDVQLDDRGLYRCTAYNSAGSVSQFARIEVVCKLSTLYNCQKTGVYFKYSY